MADWICDLYTTAIDAKAAIEALATTVNIHVVTVNDSKLGQCIMVIHDA